MARQVLPIVGAVVGAYFGNPQLGYAIGSIIGNAVDPQRLKGPRLQELPSQTASEGGYRQVVYGTCWINNTNIIDFGEVRRVTVEEQQGKGGGPIIESERLYRTYAIGLGEPVYSIRVIRKDGKIVYDARPGSNIIAESAAFAERFRFYNGSETQLPDPDLEALPHNGVGNTPYYRGTAYLVFPNDDLTDMQGRIPTYEVEAVKEETLPEQLVALVSDEFHYSGAPEDLTPGSPSMGWAANIDTVRVSPNGIYAAGADSDSSGAGRFEIRKYDENAGTWSALANPASYPVLGPRAIAWSTDGTYLAISTLTAGERVWVYERDGDTFTKLSDPGSTIPNDPVRWALEWNAEGSKLAVGNSSSLNGVYVFPFAASLGVPVGLASPGTNFIGGAPYRFAWTGNKLACANGAYAFVIDTTLSPMEVVGADIYDASSSTAALCAWAYDGDHFVVVDQSTVYVFHFDDATNTVTLISSDSILDAGATDASIDSTARYIAVAEAGNVEIIDLGTADIPAPTVLYALGTSGTSTVDFSEAPALPQYAAGPIVLADLVEDICSRCGLETSHLDLSELTDEVAGVTLGGPYDGAGAITTLMPAYFFDVYEADRRIWMPKRGAAVVQTITENDLVEEPDENTLRGQDIEYPRSLLLKYLDPGQNYAAPAAPVQRNSPDIRVKGEAMAELPISLSRTEAFRVADRMLKVMWEDLNGEVTFSLPSGPFAWLTPTDCLGLSLRGALYRVRVEKTEYAAGVVKVTARRDRQSAYTSVLTPIPLPEPTDPPASLPGDTQFVVMNLPTLTDDTDLLGVHIAMTGAEGSAWAGAQIAYRVQGATEWNVIATHTARAKMGQLTADIPSASPYYTDTTNQLQVELVYESDELETITLEEFLSEGNPVAVVNPDYTAEIMQYRYAQDDGGGNWTLSTLLRGRLNTEASEHLIGATFVDLNRVIFLPLPSSVIGETLEFRVTSLGTSPETAPTQMLVWEPQYSQQEFPVTDLTLTRGGGFITGSWSPVYRLGTEDGPVPSLNFQFWRVTLTDGTLTESFDIIEPAFSTFDSAYTGTITVSVSQLNRFTGPGPAVSESI